MNSKSRKRKDTGGTPRIWWLLAGLAILGIAAYYNSFDVPLVFDDFFSIQKNAAVRFEQFNWHILDPRAVLYLTFTFNYWLSGQDVWSYHLINLSLHLVNGSLIVFIAAHIFRQVHIDEKSSRIYAFLAAGFFLLHPIQTESVTYISSRSELLSTAFYLAAFLIFIKCPKPRIGFLLSLVIAVPFVFAMGSKETVVSLPAVLLLYDFLFLSEARFKPILKRWRFYLSFLIGGVAAIIYILTVTLQGAEGIGPQAPISSLHYFLTESRVVVRYIGLILLPVRQNLDYDLSISHSLFQPAVVASFLLLSGILLLGWSLRRKQPVFAFAIFWFFLTLAPTSSFVPIVDVMFEHRLYLPLAGVCLAFPLAMLSIEQALHVRYHLQLKYAVYVLVPLCLLLTATILRNQIWRDEVRLWTDVVSKSPNKNRPRNSLAWAYFKKGEYDDAIRSITDALRDVPNSRDSLTDVLGNLYLQTGRYDDAAQLFTNEVQAKTTSKKMAVQAYNNLGVTYLYKWTRLQSEQNQISAESFAQQKETDLRNAQSAFQHCLDLDPTMFAALHSYINASYNLGIASKLEDAANRELASKESLNSLYTLAYLAFLKGDYQRACDLFDKIEKTMQIGPAQKLVYFNHGYALDALHEKDQAIAKYRQAIELDTTFAEAHYNLGAIYKEKGDYSDAIDNLADVLRYDPSNVRANLQLAEIEGAEGKKESARKYLRTILNASPGNQQALQVWQQLGL